MTLGRKNYLSKFVEFVCVCVFLSPIGGPSCQTFLLPCPSSCHPHTHTLTIDVELNALTLYPSSILL